MKSILKNITTLLLLMVALVSCRNEEYIAQLYYSNDDEPYNESQVDYELYPDWTATTHSNSADPDFDRIFPDMAVQRIDITVSSTNWSTMWTDLSDNLSSKTFGAHDDIDFTPVWVTCNVTYDDTEWYNVGLRFKGNSSLTQPYSAGNKKLPFKLEFDQFEDDYPALKNQRFYGFKTLNLANNYNDNSMMRDKVTTDLFREYGLVAAHTAFYAVYVDYGSGAQYFGLYTIAEEVDDTVIKTQFNDNSGNLYKPDDDAGSFASGTYDTDEFDLKTNQYIPDYSDVLELYNAINSSTRTSNEEAWCERLESAFDMDVFLKWLAVNTAIQNWDTYGNKAHNFYLYNDSYNNNRLTWIPWDHNESLQDATGTYRTYTPDQYANSRYTNSSSNTWPLFYYVMNVEKYEQTLYSNLREVIDGVFEPSKMISTYEAYYNLLQQYAYDEVRGYTFLSSDAHFDSAVETLKEHVQTRYELIEGYL